MTPEQLELLEDNKQELIDEENINNSNWDE